MEEAERGWLVRGALSFQARFVVLLLVLSTSRLISGCSVTPVMGTFPEEDVVLSPSGYVADSPEGTVDAYLTAMAADDVEAMWALHAGRTWPAGEDLTHDQFVAGYEAIKARYRAAGAPEGTPCFGDHTISATSKLSSAAFSSGEEVGEVYLVKAAVQAFESWDGMGVYRVKKAAFTVWRVDGRWVVAKAEDVLP
jgi:hypothetical protein